MIYVLEDDANIRKLVDYALQREGYEVQGFGTPSEFWEAIGNRLPQLVLLDIMLPQEDGLTILNKLRSRSDTRRVALPACARRSHSVTRVLLPSDCLEGEFSTNCFGRHGMSRPVRESTG